MKVKASNHGSQYQSAPHQPSPPPPHPLPAYMPAASTLASAKYPDRRLLQRNRSPSSYGFLSNFRAFDRSLLASVTSRPPFTSTCSRPLSTNALPSNTRSSL